MQTKFQIGTYVRHVRYGPGRVVESLSDHVVLRDRHGEIFRVNITFADKELIAEPPDGFTALHYHRDINSDYLRANIEDAIIRLMRDFHHVSISVRELKDEFTPILTRDGLRWSSWWKTAWKDLSSARKLVVDPKRKGIYLLQIEQAANSFEIWATRIQTANDSQGLLFLAHGLELLANSEEKEQIRALLLNKTIAQLALSEPQTRSYTECALALCRLIDGPTEIRVVLRDNSTRTITVSKTFEAFDWRLSFVTSVPYFEANHRFETPIETIEVNFISTNGEILKVSEADMPPTVFSGQRQIRARLDIKGRLCIDSEGSSRTIQTPYFAQVGLRPPRPFDLSNLNLPDILPEEN